MYEAMVKEAYEEIMGFEKEAAGLKRMERMGDTSSPQYRYKREQSMLRDGVHLGGPSTAEINRRMDSQTASARKRSALRMKQQADSMFAGARAHLDAFDKHIEEANTPKNVDTKINIKFKEPSSTAPTPTPSVADTAAKSGWRPTGKQVAGATAAVAGLTAATLGAKALYDRHKRKQQEQAEKAAAYYDEAQFAKQAAEADYEVACAYEEAALAILDELGYLD